MNPLLLGAASTVFPSVVDLMTGASSQRRNALDRRNKMLDSLISETRTEMGPTAMESGAFKQANALLNDNLLRKRRMVMNRALAGGLTPEATAGQNEMLLRGQNNATLQALFGAQRRRDALRGQYNSLMQQRTGFDVADADATLAAQGAWTGGITRMLPYILEMDEEKGDE